MNFWLLKSEPETYSWDDLIRDKTTMWEGVRNYEARNNLRKMKLGDLAFFYHSGKNAGIIGVAEVTNEAYVEPGFANDNWMAVDIQPKYILPRFISLAEIKMLPKLHDMVLLKRSRLSVQPVKPEEYNAILELSKN